MTTINLTLPPEQIMMATQPDDIRPIVVITGISGFLGS